MNDSKSTKEERAEKAYTKTDDLATFNIWAQGVSGFFGIGVNWIVDLGVIPLYTDLWNDIRSIYGKGKITLHAAKEYLKPNMGFLLRDLIWDKGMGSIPILGIPYNVAFARAMTWRLGTWFGMLAAIGDGSTSVNDLKGEITRNSMALTREMFPSVGDVFDFKTPEKEVFISFVSSLDGLTPNVAIKRSRAALDALHGR